MESNLIPSLARSTDDQMPLLSHQQQTQESGQSPAAVKPFLLQSFSGLSQSSVGLHVLPWLYSPSEDCNRSYLLFTILFEVVNPPASWGRWQSSQPVTMDTRNKGPVHEQTTPFGLSKLMSTKPLLTTESTSWMSISLLLQSDSYDSPNIFGYLAI